MIDTIKSKIGSKPIVLRSIEDVYANLKLTKIMALDIETYGNWDLPGDCAASIHHGINAISIANMYGDAWYIPVSDGRDLPNMMSCSVFIDYLNTNVLPKINILVLHNAKFDLGFLMHRGLNLPTTLKVIDSWIVSSIRNEGIYKSSKLKEIAKEKFNIDTSTKTEIDDWLKANNTKDFGKIPHEILAPYACDDVRYALLIVLSERSFSLEESANHDLYVRNFLALNKAEATGILVNGEEIREAVGIARTQRDEELINIRANLGATQIDITNEQEMLKYMHSQNLHSGPRNMYGETQYVYDYDFLSLYQNHPLVKAYMSYHTAHVFLVNFSGEYGDIAARVFQRPEGNGIYFSFMQSLYAGGMVVCKVPDFQNKITLTNQVRSLFRPRSNCNFITIKACDLCEALLAYYCQDQEFLNDVRKNISACAIMQVRTGLEELPCKILWSHLTSGMGNAILELKLKAAGVPVAGNKHLSMKDTFQKNIKNLQDMRNNVNKSLESEGLIHDILGRVIRVPIDKRYRTHSILLTYSFGSYLNYYMDLLCKLADKCNTKFLMVHKDEFLFESPKDSDFSLLVRHLLGRELNSNLPFISWKVHTGSSWEVLA
jgi:hypothetical protein